MPNTGQAVCGCLPYQIWAPIAGGSSVRPVLFGEVLTGFAQSKEPEPEFVAKSQFT